MAAGRQTRARSRGHRVDPGVQKVVRGLIADLPLRRDLLLEYLHRIQDQDGCIGAAQVVALAAELNLAPVEVFEVASFYHHFDLVREGETPPPPLKVRVCDSLSCELGGAGELIVALRRALGEGVCVQAVPCVGRCERAPVAVVGQNALGPARLEDVLRALEQGAIDSGPPVTSIGLAAYRAAGGYALLLALVAGQRDAEGIIAELEHAGLRGLGGAGFPTGRKWRIVREQPAPRYLAVNIDEGEPGTFKDRWYLERDPHRMLEGMLIAAQVVGAARCYLYVRDEYPLVRRVLASALAELRDAAMVPLPEIELRRGAGAYVCGEESAMLESIEGRRGMPRLRPPYVAERGLFERPTLVNNAETLYWVREVLERGAEWFAAQGRRGRSGLRSFSVSGRVRQPGVCRAPAGISLRELIEEHCGGMAPGHRLHAYLPGGAAGGILPARLADLPLDFDALQAHGALIGSAAVIVLSQQDSARAAALNAMRFFAHESCGRCTPCRAGTERAAALMSAPHWDRVLLEDLAAVMEETSICGLGQAAPNPLRSVLRYFPEEVGE